MVVFIIIWSLWFVSEILLNRLYRSGSDIQKDRDKNTLSIIWITVGIANTTGILFAIFSNHLLSHLIVVRYVGLLLIVTGMIIRFGAVWSLGRFFTVDVAIRDDHRLKKNGAYKFIRHPSYLGMLISFLGFSISLNNWISLLIIIIPVTIVVLYRIKIEERILMDQFGKDYLEYMKSTRRLLPGIY